PGKHLARRAAILEEHASGIRSVDCATDSGMKQNFARSMPKRNGGEFNEIFRRRHFVWPQAMVHRGIAYIRGEGSWIIMCIATPFSDPDRLHPAVLGHQFFQ